MKEVNIKSHFFYNIDRSIALDNASRLEAQIELMVANWLRDTGLWGSKFSVELEPVRENQAITAVQVTVFVDVDRHPYVVERANGQMEYCE